MSSLSSSYSASRGVGELSTPRALLISVRPRYMNAILDGSKTVELRRTRPNLEAGSLVLLYSSSPVKQLVGWARLASIGEGTLEGVWQHHGRAAAVSKADYRAYFEGASRAFALVLHDVIPAVTPVALSELRRLGVAPPQSWRYVSDEFVAEVHARADVGRVLPGTVAAQHAGAANHQ